MENEVRTAGTQRSYSTSKVLDASELHPGSYETMRQSLEEAERRGAMLAQDMSQQVDTNEELVENMSVLKDANKRLLEQIRLQTDEITQLTQQRVSDEERMDYITMKHRDDHEAFRQDTQKRALAVEDVASQRYASVHGGLAEQLRYFQKRLTHVGQDTAGILEDQRHFRGDTASFADAMRDHIESAVQKAGVRCDGFSAAQAQRLERSRQEVQDLELELRGEEEARQTEELSWSHRLSEVALDMEDVQARRARDTSQLSSHLQGLERLLSAERSAWAEERGRLIGRCDEMLSRHAEREKALEESRARRAQLEATIAEATSDLRVREKAVIGLQQALRESDDALAAAVSGNEHLREQLEEQRKYFQERNERDLSQSRDVAERKLGRAREAYCADSGVSIKQMQALEEKVQGDGETCQLVRSQVDVVALEIDSLERQVGEHQDQHEAGNSERLLVEQVSAEARQKAALDLLHLQMHSDELAATCNALTDEIQGAEEDLSDMRRAAGAKEAEQAARMRSAESELRDAREQLAVFKRRQLESAEARSRSELEQAGLRHETLDTLASLERRIEECRSGAMESRKSLTATLQEAKAAAEEAKEQLYKEREAGPAMLRQAQIEGRSKLSEAEQNRARAEEACRADVVSASEAFAQQRKRYSSCEYDLNQMRSMLSKSKENLSRVLQEFEREDREASMALRHMGDDTRTAQSALDKALRDDAALQLRLEEVQRRNEQERALLVRKLEEARRETVTKAAEEDSRLHRARVELEAELREGVDRHNGSRLSAEGAQEEALLHENDRLRSLLQEQGRGSASLSAMQSKLEEHISRLQRSAAVAAAELRSGLRDAAGSAEPVGGAG